MLPLNTPRIAAVLAIVAISLGSSAGSMHPSAFELIADDLANPRGVAVLPGGDLILAEAGTGRHEGPGRFTGRLLRLVDHDGDGRWLGSSERRVLLSGQISYNGRSVFGTDRDEVGGLGDVVLGPGDLVLYTKDDPFEGYLADGTKKDIAIAAMPATGGDAFAIAHRLTTLNALAWDPVREEIFVLESGANRLVAVTLQGHARVVARFEALAHGQQAVPAGMDRDPATGDLLVALFSGVLYDAPNPGDRQSFVPGAAKVVRVHPDTGTIRDEVTGLTTAVDVAVGQDGTLYVLEFTSGPPTERLPDEYDLDHPEGAPLAGGYARFAGRLTAYRPNDVRSVLVTGLDAPTNVTATDDALYVSTGQGTPGRPIPVPGGTDRIRGRLWRMPLPQ